LFPETDGITEMTRILVTGGAGFIGSHTVQQLLQLGKEVSVIDDLNDFYPPAMKLGNLAKLRETGPVRFYECDICDANSVSRIVEEARPEAIIHLAARAGVRPSLERPLLYEQVNVGGTVALLEAARTCGVGKFVFASSSSVYGAASAVPFREDDRVDRPISPYAATKIAGERLCYTYSHLYGLQVVCLRFFTVYGPRQRPDLAIRKFTEMIDRGDPIPVFGDPNIGGRDYTYVDDIIQGVISAVRLDCSYDVFNLGNASPISLATLIDSIEHALGKKADIRSLPPQAGDVPITFADIRKAGEMLNYSPTTPFAQGIQQFVAWFREQKNSGSTAKDTVGLALGRAK
jgi:UDP-glucuronate 4-epimerase